MKLLKSNPWLSIVDCPIPSNIINLEYYRSLYDLCLVTLCLITGVTLAMQYNVVPASEFHDYIMFYLIIILLGIGGLITSVGIKLIYVYFYNKGLGLRFLSFLYLVREYAPYFILLLFFLNVLINFGWLAGWCFVNLIPIVYCEGIEDPFSIVREFTNLSSLDTRNMIKEAYSGVSGIYIFQNTETGGIYIGSSISLYDRFYSHLHDIDSNIRLQNAVNKYGWDSFTFRLIETCLSTELATREQFNLDILFKNFPKELVYNFCAVAYSILGYTHTTETKAALRAASSARNSGKNNPMFGKTHTAQSRDQIRLNQPNRKPVFVYDLSNSLVGEYPSIKVAATALNCSIASIFKTLDTGKRLRKIYLITSRPLS